MAPALRVLVTGDDALARGGLAALVSGRPDLAVVGPFAAEEVVAAVRATAPDVVLWDVGSGSGAEADGLRDLADAGAPPVVVLVDHEGRVPDLLGAGARGVLARNADPFRLAAAVQAAARGLVVVEASLAAGALRVRGHAEPLVEPLTARELEVLRLLGEGLSNRGLARRLGISEHTAKFHVNAILGKLGAQSRAEAVAQGARLGLILL